MADVDLMPVCGLVFNDSVQYRRYFAAEWMLSTGAYSWTGLLPQREYEFRLC